MVNWFVVFLGVCTISSLLINVVVRKLPSTLYFKKFLLLSKKTQVNYFGPKSKILIYTLATLDLLFFGWGLSGVIISLAVDSSGCF